MKPPIDDHDNENRQLPFGAYLNHKPKNHVQSYYEEQALEMLGKQMEMMGKIEHLIKQLSHQSSSHLPMADSGNMLPSAPVSFISYGSSVLSKKNKFSQTAPLPAHFFQTREWKFSNSIIERFKAMIYELSYQLQKTAQDEITDYQRARCNQIMDELNEALQEAGDFLRETEHAQFAWGYLFKEIFPFFWRSRFVERVFYKPKGYAGDFMMIEMLYHNQPSGDGKLGELMDGWCLNTSNARAVRARRKLLTELLRAASSQMLKKKRKLRILNLACGSSRELFDFLAKCDYSEAIEATCVDIDIDALNFINREVNTFVHKASVKLLQDDLLKWIAGRTPYEYGEYDVIYSSGLTDYFQESIFIKFINRCHKHLCPNGILVVGNFSDKNPHRVFMDQIILWQLIHRSASELRGLFAKSDFGAKTKIISEEHTINYFAVAKK